MASAISGMFMANWSVSQPEQIVAAVDVDRAEDAERRGQRDLVLEGVAGEDRVVLLDIDLHILLEAVGLSRP